MLNLVCSIVVLVAGLAAPSPARAEDGLGLRDTFAPVMSAWRDVVRAVPDPWLSHAEKSATIDALFAALGRAADVDGEGVLTQLGRALSKATTFKPPDGARKIITVDEQNFREALDKLTDLLKDKDFGREWAAMRDRLPFGTGASTANPGADPNVDPAADPAVDAGAAAAGDLPPSIEDFVNASKPYASPERLRLALKLVRDIIALEERHVFTLLADSDNRPLQAQTLATLGTDLNFLGRQGLALARLIQIGLGAHRSAHPDGEYQTLTEVELRRIFDEAYPRLLKSIDDLGLYYCKLIQSFSALIYHFSPEAYDKIDRFMGMMPRKLSYEQLKAVIETDLGRPIETAFVSFAREPFANGSMGQVHRATLRDERGVEVPVVVKIQKDFVVKELDWNMKTNGIVFDALEGLTPEEYRWMVNVVTTQANELGETFRDESDSRAEAARQVFFRRMLKPVAHHNVPRVFTSHVGARVLTTAEVPNARRVHQAFTAPDATTVRHPQFVDRRAPRFARPSADEAEEDDEVVDTAPDGTEAAGAEQAKPANVGRLIFRLHQQYGYELGPRYLQTLRSVLPIFSTSLLFSKLRLKYARAGLDGHDEIVQKLDWVTEAFERAVIYQVLYAREVHADYNWGNLLVDDAFETNLVDFANSAVTRGLVLRPLVLLMGFAKGDARLVLKKLTQVGAFANLPADRAAILNEIEATMTNYAIPKRSWPGFARATWREWRAHKKISKPSAADDDFDAPEESGKTISMNLTEPVVGGAPRPTAPPNAAAQAGLSFAKTFAKMTVGFPYHRARVALLRSRICQRFLGTKN